MVILSTSTKWVCAYHTRQSSVCCGVLCQICLKVNMIWYVCQLLTWMYFYGSLLFCSSSRPIHLRTAVWRNCQSSWGNDSYAELLSSLIMHRKVGAASQAASCRLTQYVRTSGYESHIKSITPDMSLLQWLLSSHLVFVTFFQLVFQFIKKI